MLTNKQTQILICLNLERGIFMNTKLAVVLLLFLTLIFGSSSITIKSTNPVDTKTTVTMTFEGAILDWSLVIASDNYTSEKYFYIDQPGYYLIFADGTAPKGQVTISIINSSGKEIKSIKASQLKKEQKIYLQPGRYKVVVKTKNSKHTNYRVWLNFGN